MKTSGAWRWLRQTLGALCISTLVACGGGGGGSDPTPPVDPTLGSVAGLVVSAETGLPMAGVAVTSGTASATTAADGTYTLNNVAPGAAVVAFSATNHARGFANATVAAGATATAGVRLTPIGVRQTFAASAGATVSVPGTPAQVSLPAAGIVDRNGAAFSGTVTAEITPINPALDPGNMPGDMTTSVGGAMVPIESFGALTVTLQDAGGNRLNLASGSTATVRIPLATRSASPPATVPLFYFNETTGLWVEEGTATLQGSAPDQYYEGTVSHFTTWNADQVANTVTVTGCVQESNAARVANVRLRSDGLDYSGASTAVTDAGGSFSIAIRRGSRATLAGEIGGRYSNAVEVGPSESTITLANCLLLGNGTPVFVLQPRSQSVTEGGYVVLQALARGQAPMRYQWQRNGVDIAGATTSALLVDPVRNDDNGAIYRAVATNAAGSTPSEDATLTVASLPPAIAVQPAPQSVVAGTNATFTVQMQPQGAPLTYEWRRDGNAISGAPNLASYTLSSAQLADSGAVFSVRISNSVGGVTSNGAALTVTAAPVAPSITQQPQAVSVNVGQTAQFTVVASGSQPLSYQWRRNGAAIEGALEATYTINAVALADNGAVFSVVVSNSVNVSGVASGNATLTVTEPPAGGGYYHVAQSGAPVSGAIVFANGAQSHNSPALVAVRADDPSGGAATVEAAGVAAMLYSPAFEATLSAGQASNVRQRYSFYFKNSRLHRLDQLSPSGTPAGQIISTLVSADVCGEGGHAYAAGNLETLMDIADPSRTWVLLRGPGADGNCMTADDVTRAVRAGMSNADAALSLSGTPLVEIIGSNGALSGVIVADGLTLKRLDANLANPTTLHTLGAATSDDFVYGSALPGIWLFKDGDRIYAYKLDGSGGAPAVVVNLTTAEAAMGNWRVTGSGGAAYLAIGDGTGTRLLRIGSDLVVTSLGSGPATVYELMATPTRLIITGMDGVSSMPLAGGAATVLAANSAMQYLGQVELAGETLYVTRQGFSETTGMTQSVLVVQSDGSNPQTLDATAIVGTMMAASVPMTTIIDDNSVYALILAQGVGGDAQYSGATLRSVDGSARTTLTNYGALPTVTSGGLMVMPVTMAPAQYGQSGLLSLMTFSETGEAMGLMYFDSDVTDSLRVITAPVSNPTGARMRPATTRLQPAVVMQPDGLGHVKVIRRTSPLVR